MTSVMGGGLADPLVSFSYAMPCSAAKPSHAKVGMDGWVRGQALLVWPAWAPNRERRQGEKALTPSLDSSPPYSLSSITGVQEGACRAGRAYMSMGK